MRFAARGARAGSQEARPVVLQGPSAVLAWVLCAMPLLMGFVAPVLFMLRPLWTQDWDLPWARFVEWSLNSLRLGLITALLAVGLAVLLAFLQRRHPDRLTRGVVGLASVGYAVPGAVVVVGLLLPVAWLQTLWPQSSVGYWITATSLGLVWAYLVRFSGVALQSVQSGYARIPMSLDESARMMGSSDARLLREVHYPLLKGPAVAAALLVFVDVMKELPATLVLRPFNSDTLAVVTYQLARDERLGEAALPALALVLVGLIPVIMLSRTLRDEPNP
jgi:iron(III) transport system permease protein